MGNKSLNSVNPNTRLSSQGWGKEKAGRKRIEDRGGGETVDKATLKLTSYSPASAWMYRNVRRSYTKLRIQEKIHSFFKLKLLANVEMEQVDPHCRFL